MEVEHLPNGMRVRLPLAEGLILKDLPENLRDLLKSPDFTNKMVQRLFPDAYSDEAFNHEYHRLTDHDLRMRKLAGIQVFEDSLRHWKLADGEVTIIITKENFAFWLGFINDMRLVLGTQLDIEEADWSRAFDENTPNAPEMALLHYLSWLEENLITSDARGRGTG